MSDFSISLDRRRFLSGGAALLGTGLAGAIAPAGARAATASQELEFAGALEAARAIRRKQVSSLELTNHLIARIEKFDPKRSSIAKPGSVAEGAKSRASSLRSTRSSFVGIESSSQTSYSSASPVNDRFGSEGVDYCSDSRGNISGNWEEKLQTTNPTMQTNSSQ